MLLSIPRLKEFVGRNLLAKPNLLGMSLQLVLRLLAVLVYWQGTQRSVTLSVRDSYAAEA